MTEQDIKDLEHDLDVAIQDNIRWQLICQYMRNVVKAYVDVYEDIGRQIKQLGDDEEPSEELEGNMELCFDVIQPLLTLYEDTKPENIDETLAGHSLSAINRITNPTLN